MNSVIDRKRHLHWRDFVGTGWSVALQDITMCALHRPQLTMSEPTTTTAAVAYRRDIKLDHLGCSGVHVDETNHQRRTIIRQLP